MVQLLLMPIDGRQVILLIYTRVSLTGYCVLRVMVYLCWRTVKENIYTSIFSGLNFLGVPVSGSRGVDRS